MHRALNDWQNWHSRHCPVVYEQVPALHPAHLIILRIMSENSMQELAEAQERLRRNSEIAQEMTKELLHEQHQHALTKTLASKQVICTAMLYV